jgi:hypothetical protein
MVTYGIFTEKVPFLILAGKRQKTRKRITKDDISNDNENTGTSIAMFVLASLWIPKILGSVFEYKIDKYENNNSDLAIDQAMAAYLSVLNKGLSVASNIMKNTTSTPIPTSGQNLYFGRNAINKPILIASPLHKSQLNVTSINQGEMFSVVLSNNLIETLSEPSRRTCFQKNWKRTLNQCTAEPSDARLLFKVSSCAMFHPLIHPKEAFSAIKEVFILLNETKAPYIFDVLLGAYQISDFGMVLLMKDLGHSYVDLQPNKYCTKFELWKQYTALDNKALIPLADINLYHADIRLGWDITSNIMMTKNDHTEMRLIDYDSLTSGLMTSEQKNAFHYTSDMYGNKQNYSYHRVVWWQCLLAA